MTMMIREAYLRESTVIEKIFHDHQVHLRCACFATAILVCFPEANLVTTKYLGEQSRTLPRDTLVKNRRSYV